MWFLITVAFGVCIFLQQKQLRRITRRLDAVAAAADDVVLAGEFYG